MKILFVRHGESLANVKLVKASDPDFLNGLTENGLVQAQLAAQSVRDKITTVYASPYYRTMLTAQTFCNVHNKDLDILVDDRLREIDYGLFGDNKSHPEMIEVAQRQIAGDYEVRFGRIGENKRELITRLFGFLIDIFNKHDKDDVILAISHGRVISILDYEFGMVNGIQKEHESTKNAGIKEFILDDKTVQNLKTYFEKLNQEEIRRRVDCVEKYAKKNTNLYPHLLELARDAVDDIDVSYAIIEKFVQGAYSQNITQLVANINKNKISDTDVMLATVFKDADNFIEHFIQHYKNIGVSKFVFINNGSTDKSITLLKQIANNDPTLSIDIWTTNEDFNGVKSMGWKQQVMSHYGLNRWWLLVDIDELFVFRENNICNLAKRLKDEKKSLMGAIMIDMYPKQNIKQIDSINVKDIIKDYKYFDKAGYTKHKNNKYQYRFFGGMRKRMFNVIPSLQKYPLIYITENVIGINPHFWYPYSLNNNAETGAALLHYKFLPNDLYKYLERINKGVYYNDSFEYKAYLRKIEQEPDCSLYSPEVSKEYTNFFCLNEILDS